MNWTTYWLEKAEEHFHNGKEQLMWAVLLLNYIDGGEA